MVGGAIIRGFLPGVLEGGPITDQYADLETLIQALLGRFDARLIADRLELAHPNMDVETNNVRRWRSVGPSPLSAWRIGEALRWSDGDSAALLPQASGLLALIWAGHLKDLVAVVAGCDRALLARHEARLLGMLGTIEAAAYASPYDVLPAERFSLVGATAEDLHAIVEAGAPVHPVPTHGAEARRLERRAQAWTIWHLPADLHAATVIAADLWFSRSAAEQSALVSGWPETLRVAYDVGRSNVARATASAVLREWLLRWFYSAGSPEPEPFSVGQYLMMLVDPSGPDATAMLRAFRSYAIAEAQPEAD